MPVSTTMNKVIQRTLTNQYRRSAQARSGIVKPTRAIQFNGNASASMAGSPVSALGVTAPGRSSVAVQNVGRLANAIYRPSTASSIVHSFGSGAGGGSGGGGGSDTLAGLDDVGLTTLADGHILQYDLATGKWINVVPVGGSGGAPSPHDLSGPHHSGLLNWTLLSKSGSSLGDLANRDHNLLSNVLSDQHHPKVHTLVGPDHTATGLTVGWVVRATGATTFAWEKLLHNDLAGVTANQHHNQVHNIVGGDHTISGTKFKLVGAIDVDTLGLLTPTHNPGATEAILKTDIYGSLMLDSDLLYVDGEFNRVAINRATAVAPESGAALDVVVSNLSDHTQRIKQKFGQLGRLWRIENTDGDELIVLDSVGNLQSGRPGFVSGLTGWQITPGGNAEFNNIWARGELHATVFVKDEVHATGGTFMVATAGKLHSDAEIDAGTVDSDVLEVESAALGWSPGQEPLPLEITTTSPSFEGTTITTEGIGNVIEIDDPPSGHGLYFQPGEILRVKTEINEEGNDLRLADLWLEVMSATQVYPEIEGDKSYSRYSVTKKSGSDCTIPAGTGIVSYGQRGDGRILMTSDWRSDEGYTPYIDVFTTGQNPWDANDPTAIIPRMRMGQLKGVGVPGTTVPLPGDGLVGVTGVPQWGMIAGTDLTNANTSYFIASNLGIRMYKVPLTFNNGNADTGLWTADGNIRIGRNIANDATTGFRIITKSAIATEEGNVIIGNTATGNFLRWNQETGILTVSGSLLVTDPGGTVTYAQVVELDGIVRTDAQGYAATALTDAKIYVNDRTVTKVTGTWGATVFGVATANTIAWGTTVGTVNGVTPANVAVHFANGSSKSVVTGSTGVMSVRTYLYVDTSQATLTIIPQTTQVVTNPNYVLIAVCDPGSPKASVTVVGGSTYISGGNIFTQSILATNIAVGAITANEIAATTITSTRMAAEFFSVMSSGYITPIANAKRDEATLYSNDRRLVGVLYAWIYGPIDSNIIGWSGLQLRFGDGSTRAVTNNAGGITLTTSVTYLIVDVSQVTLTMVPVTSINSITANHVLVAVARWATLTDAAPTPGSGYPTLEVTAGATIISGDSIITGSIVSKNIAALAITADKINVTTLSAIKTSTGSLSVTGDLIVGTTGRMYSTGKTSYANPTPGFFLGWDTTSGGAYRFGIGNNDAYLRWTGTDIAIKTRQALQLVSEDAGILVDGGTVLTFMAAGELGVRSLNYYWNAGASRGRLHFDGVLDAALWLEGPVLQLYAPELAGTNHDAIIFTHGAYPSRALNFDGSRNLLTYGGDFAIGGYLRLPTQHSPVSNAFGDAGQITWDGQYLYVCVGANTWRRAILSAY